MIVIGYGSIAEEPRHPLVPDWVVVSDPESNYILSKDGIFEGPVGDTTFKPLKPSEVPDRNWLGVMEDGTVETFETANELQWRTRKAISCVEEADRVRKTDLIRAVECLKNAAAVMDVGLGNLVRELSALKSDSSESIADAFARIRASGTQ